MQALWWLAGEVRALGLGDRGAWVVLNPKP